MTPEGRAAALPNPQPAEPESQPHFIAGRHGVFAAYASDAYLGEAVLKYGEYGEHEFLFLSTIWSSLPAPRGCIVEVGANAGYLTVPLMKLAEVFAFEPQPPVFKLLLDNVTRNGPHKGAAHVYQLAVSDEVGSIQCPVVPFTDERANHGGVSMLPQLAITDYETVEVPCVTLDQKIAKPVSLVKVDVEGMELQVLKGAKNLIATDQPVLYVENDRPEKSRALIRFVWELGYQCWFHLPPLFNPHNFFGKKENLWPGTVSVNILCLPNESELPDEFVKQHNLIRVTSERQLP